MLHFVYVVRELILELLSEVVLAAPPSILPTESSVNSTNKPPWTGGNSRDFFLGLFEHLPVLCPKKHPETTTKSTLQQGGTPAIFFSGLIQALSPMDRNAAPDGVQNKSQIEPKGIKNRALGHPKVGYGVEFEMEPQIWCQKRVKP